MQLQEKCSAAKGGMLIGTISFIIAGIFIMVGLIMSIIFGVKIAVDHTKKKLTS